ncbi:MAG: hypothetical protein AABZ32_03950, partial [Bacteroidota bacterium]
MKKFVQTFLFFLLNGTAIYLYAQNHSTGVRETAGGAIVSTEIQNISGTISISVKYYFTGATTINQNPVYELPGGWTAASSMNLAGNTYYPNDSLLWTFNISYPLNLPFYPQKIKVALLTNSKIVDNIQEFQKINTSGMVYFTPYNTVEIWSIQDFQNLPRRWLEPEQSPNAVRIPVNKNDISQSTIDTINWENIDWDDHWQTNFREVKIAGLAYNILMKAVPPDSIEYFRNYGDGPDSTDATGGNGILSIGKTFTGKVYGYLRSQITNDLRVPLKIYFSEAFYQYLK